MPSNENDPPNKDEVRKRWIEELGSVLDQREKTKQVLDRLGWYSPTHPVEALRNYQALRRKYNRLGRKADRLREQIPQFPIPQKNARRRVKSPKPKYVRFERSGDRISVEPGFIDRELLNTYNMLVAILKKVRAYVLERQGKVTIAVLKKAFRSANLSQFSNDDHLTEWIEVFTNGATPGNIALVHLEKTTGLKRSTIKRRLSQAR